MFSATALAKEMCRSKSLITNSIVIEVDYFVCCLDNLLYFCTQFRGASE